MKHFFTFLLPLICLTLNLQAQTKLKLAKSIPIDKAQLFTTDQFGNAFIVNGQNNLIRYAVNGDSLRGVSTISNGDIQWIDATNPLRILLFYPQYSTISILDKMLSVKSEIALKKLSLFQVTAAATSADGNIWVYNEGDAKLIKINDLQQVVSQSNDLRQETQTVPQISSIVEDEAIVYLCDSTNGIYTFDNYGRFLNILPFLGVKRIQIIDDQILFLKENYIHIYNKRSFKESKMELPNIENLLDARLERNYLFMLYQNRLDIFYTDN